MAYIGNTPFTAAFLTDTFSGNGSTVAFTMSVAPANTSSILVAVTGVLQDPSTYSVSGTTLTFSAAPPTGTSNISVRYLGIPASGVTTTAYRTVTEFTATASQTTFSVPSYTVGYVDVYRNGVMLGSADYTATSGTTIVLASGATAGDLVEVISFYVSSVLNAIPATAGSVGTTYLADNAVTTAKIAAGAVIPADLSTGAPSWDSSSNVGIGTSSPAASLSIAKQTTALSGTSNSYGVYLYPTSSGQCWLDAVTSSSSNTSMGLRSYNNGTYYTANLDNSGNFQFNSGYGSTAVAYGCRAWVNFNGTGTVAIRASGNVSSITDNGTGDYTVNFTNAMPDANYAAAQAAGDATLNGRQSFGFQATPTTTTYRVLTTTFGGANFDASYVTVTIFR